MVKRYYDALVIRSGMGGMSSAALLSHAGYRTLVVEKLPRIGGRCSTIEYRGVKCTRGVIGPEMGGVLEKLFQDVGAEFDVRPAGPPHYLMKGKLLKMPSKGGLRTLLASATNDPAEVQRVMGLVFFSPLREADLPPDLDGLYFGGGYPELFAEALSANTPLRTRVREKSLEGMPVYAECGGFMYLCTDLQGGNGRRFPMAGCFPSATRMLPRLKALGYREVCLSRDAVLGRRGAVMRGHEFHYSEIVEPLPPAQTAYRVAGRAGMERTLEGYVSRRTLGSYIHLHWGSEPQAADAFVQACRSYRNERNSAHATA